MEINIENLARSFNGNSVLNNINWKIERGFSHLVTGPNGSGKSTLLKMLAGILRPTAGSIQISKNGKIIDPAKARTSIGLVSSEVNLYERLTALENLAFFAALRGLKKREKDIRLLLERFQIDGVCHQPTAVFSTGMKQRLKLAFALLHEPEILLLDEPSSNLDEGGKALVDDLVQAQLQKGIVVIATNDLREVEKYGERILRLAAPPVGSCSQGST